MPAGADTKVQINLKTHGDTLINIYANTPEEFGAWIRAEIAKWGQAMQDAKVPKI